MTPYELAQEYVIYGNKLWFVDDADRNEGIDLIAYRNDGLPNYMDWITVPWREHRKMKIVAIEGVTE